MKDDRERPIPCGESARTSAGNPGRPGSRTDDHLQAPVTLPLEAVTPGQRWLVGGKGANLALLRRAGLPVPPGFCLTAAAFDRFLDASGKRPELGRLLAQSSPDRAPRIQDLSAMAGAWLAGVPIPPPVEAAILAAWRVIGEHRIYAVRSSATVEDAADHSFAGQFESILNVQGREALLAAVKGCWVSLFSPGSIAYHAREHLPLGATGLAVVIQEMVPAEAAGVLFTMDPVSGDPERIVIEAASGLGDRLVSGVVDPEGVVLEKASLRILKRRTPSEPPLLDDALVRRLAKLGRRAEHLFSYPVDLEWGAARGRLFLFQARPVTTALKPRSWEDRQRWSNVNTGEIFPDVATPMTWSVVQLIFEPLFASLFRLGGAQLGCAPAAGLVAGRIYFNLNTGIAAVKPFRLLVGRLADITQAIGGGAASEQARAIFEIPDSDVPDLGFRWPKYVLSWPRIVYDLITHAPRRGDAWFRGLEPRTDERVRRDVESLSTPELVEFLAGGWRGDFADWDLLYLITQAPALPLFRKACRDWLDDPKLTLGYRLFAGLGGVPEAEAGLALWRLGARAHEDSETEAAVDSGADWREVHARLTATEQGRRFLSAWDEFMSEHGHHCRGELELFSARWRETPDYILGIVRGYLRSLGQSNPVENQARLAEERRRLTEQCRQRLTPLRRWWFSRALNRAQKLTVNREVWKNQAVRRMFYLRRALLALGERLHAQGVLSRTDDIFFLEVSEVREVATGRARFNHRDRILGRRQDYERNQALSPPPGVVGRFDPATTPAPALPPNPGARVIEGIPVSPGVVTGRARVILHSDANEQVLPGEILVAPFTDPAWTPYFISAAGVVMDQGGVLSHGSIVAREFGLPAVTNTISAARTIRTGDLVQVDGDNGRVTVLQPESEVQTPQLWPGSRFT